MQELPSEVQAVPEETFVCEQRPVLVVQVSVVQTLLSLQSALLTQPPHEALLVQVSVQAEEVLAVEVQALPEQAAWLPETVLWVQVPLPLQASEVQLLLSEVQPVPEDLLEVPVQAPVQLIVPALIQSVPPQAWP